MSRTEISPLLAEISNPTSLTAQIAALRRLKNEIIGYKEKKQIWVQSGVIAPIARLLGRHNNIRPKSTERDALPDYPSDGGHISEEQEVRRQAAIIISSIARGEDCDSPENCDENDS